MSRYGWINLLDLRTIRKNLPVIKTHKLSYAESICHHHVTIRQNSCTLSRTDVNKHALRDNRKGTGHILATINGVECIIVTFNDKIAAIPLSERWSNAKTYGSFAEMGNPALSVLYRTHRINI